MEAGHHVTDMDLASGDYLLQNENMRVQSVGFVQAGKKRVKIRSRTNREELELQLEWEGMAGADKEKVYRIRSRNSVVVKVPADCRLRIYWWLRAAPAME